MISFVFPRAMRSVSTMLTCFIVTLLLWQHALPTNAEITDAQYKRYAEQLRRDRLEMTAEKQQQLQNNLLAQCNKWNIAGLMIYSIIPPKMVDAAQTLWNPVSKMSQSHNEFIWELLKFLQPFALFLGGHNIHPVHKSGLQNLRDWMWHQHKYLGDQIRLAMGESQGFFSEDPDQVGMIDLNAEVTRVNEALMFYRIPVVYSLTQTELIEVFYDDWCIGDRIYQALAVADEQYAFGIFVCSNDELYALALSQLVVGRLQLMKRSISAFLKECTSRARSEWLDKEIVRLESLVTSIQAKTEVFQIIAKMYMEKWSRNWTGLLGNDVGEYRQKMESEFKEYIGGRRARREVFPLDWSEILSRLPVPEYVPPTYLEFAAKYNEMQYQMSDEESSRELCYIYNAAASAAGPAGGAGSSSNPVMDQQLGVSRVEHDAGHASSSRSRRRHRGSGSQPSLD
ncbi:hypothetical protein SeLEV6574_g05804 [Synchytrium endobioticum]|uniref:Uncharacterized protein n=1 Tax=Synchytrium endobioticum TaxID=286115 RepID=A0A507CSI1_9FUNG|nr:hypothetical protein SeLEV6574_g05804 [Synchytrium endobioticum]